MSNKHILTGATVELRNKTAGLSTTQITTNKEKIKIKSATFGNELNTLDKPLEITGNLTVNGNAIITGSVSSENPAIDIVRHLLPEAGVVADSSLLPVRKDGDTGWHVKNTAGPPQKANYYLYADTNTANTYTLADLKFMSLLVNIITGGNMFLFVYTKPQGAGDAGSWYRSRINYGFQTGSTPETGDTLLYVGADDLTENPDDIFTNVKRAKLTKEAFSSVGPQDPSEEILTMGIGTDSSATVNSIDYVLKVFSYKMKHRINSFLFVLDIEHDETQTRALIESYGYQTASDVSTAISTALTDYETTAEIDARGYLTQPEIEALIPVPVVNNYLTFGYINPSNWTIVGLDANQYFSTSNNLVIENGGAYWSTDEYTIQEEGNYQATIWISADTHYSTQFTVILEEYDAGGVPVFNYRGWWNGSAYGRGSTMITRSRPAGSKLKIRVYSPSAGNFPLRGFQAGDRFHTYFTIHKV